MNVVTLVGQVVRDPELRYSEGGLAITNFHIETTDEREGKVTVTHVPVTAFGTLAEQIAEDARKGSLIEATGKVNVRMTKSKDGSRTFENISIVAGKANILAGAAGKPARMTVDTEELVDLPF